MFEKILVMASRDMIKVFFNLLILHQCFLVLLLLLSYHSILGSSLGSGHEKGSNPRFTGITLENWVSKCWKEIL